MSIKHALRCRRPSSPPSSRGALDDAFHTTYRMRRILDHLRAVLHPTRMPSHPARARGAAQSANGAAVREHHRQSDGGVSFVVDAAVVFEDTFRFEIAQGEEWRSHVRDHFVQLVDTFIEEMEVEDMRPPEMKLTEDARFRAAVERESSLWLLPDGAVPGL